MLQGIQKAEVTTCQVDQGHEHSQHGKVQSFWRGTADMLLMGYCIEQSESMHRQQWPS